MGRVIFTWLLLVATLSAAERPNVLVILTDDMRWDALGVVQQEQSKAALFPWFKTPNLDRLANEGVRFRNAFCTTSLCSPSRASFLSGQYAHRHQVLNNFTDFPNELSSYPRRLRDAGYRTAYIGKWHMGEDDDRQRPGFDYWMSHRGQGNYNDNEFNINGTRQVRKGYYSTVVTEAAVEWIRQKHDRPWLMVLGHKAPHGGPITPDVKYAKAFDNEAIRKPVNAESYTAKDGKPKWLEESFPTWHGLGGPLYGQKEYGAFVRAYLGCIASVDDSVGQLYQTLKDSKQLDQTIIIFTTDNGFALGDHGRVDKRTAYEESLRLPLLVRYPPLVKAGTIIDEMVLSLDLAPTLVELGGGKPLTKADGRSWLPLLAGQKADWRKAFFYQYNYEAQFPYTPNVRAIRTDEWKYIRYPHGDGKADRHLAELYHLKSDPHEMKNLINQPAHAAKVKELATQLDALMKQHEATPDRPPLDEGIRNVLPKF